MTVLCVVPVDWWSEGLLPFLPQPDDKKVDAFQQRHTQLHLHGAKGQAVTMTTPHLCVLWCIWTPDLYLQWLELIVYSKQLLRNAKQVNRSVHEQHFVYSTIIKPIIQIMSSLNHCVIHNIWLSFFCGTKKEILGRMFTLLFSIQLNWTVSSGCQSVKITKSTFIKQKLRMRIFFYTP